MQRDRALDALPLQLAFDCHDHGGPDIQQSGAQCTAARKGPTKRGTVHGGAHGPNKAGRSARRRARAHLDAPLRVERVGALVDGGEVLGADGARAVGDPVVEVGGQGQRRLEAEGVLLRLGFGRAADNPRR